MTGGRGRRGGGRGSGVFIHLGILIERPLTYEDHQDLWGSVRSV